ncbi:MAG: 4-hydroxyacetophenone monooxygenase [Moraxellaceae bacterium]|nr:4-hydroxyacetophenone monooxygenase [Moraxellaceae bacterium]
MTSQAQFPSSKTQILDAVIVGAGFGGLCAAIKLREAGHGNIVILEKGEDVGGTWNFNSYPGAACDVQSHMYSFSFEGNPNWSKRFAPQPEIKQYIDDVTAKRGIRPFVRFGQVVNEARFDEATALWTVRTEKGDTFTTRYFIIASGPLHVPAFPTIKGLDKFKGKVMHSSQWDHSYDLAGKNVVSIGTGASAIQYCPAIAPQVRQLTVMQRTPAWVIPRDERRYLGIEKTLFAKFPLLRKLHRARYYWTNEIRLAMNIHPLVARTLEALVKGVIRLQVKDPDLRRKLTPDYTIGCKRILISNEWYRMFNRPNVELVTEGIREITERGVVTADGVERPADCIVLGTGFVVDPRIYMKNFPVIGQGGRDLRQDWKAGSNAYLGTTISGFPNLFQLVGPNTGLGHNSIIFMIEAQVHYVLECMKLQQQKQADYIEVKATAQQAFNAQLQRDLQGTVWTSGCKSWYVQEDGTNATLWPYTTVKFWLDTRKVKTGDYVFGICSAKLGAPQKEKATA